MLNYSESKYEVEKWLTKEKLNTFVKKINEGDRFEGAYQNYKLCSSHKK